jgi:hypothetical protein
MDNEVGCPFCGTKIKVDASEHLKVQHQGTNPSITDANIKLAQHMMKLEQRIKSLESH